MRRLRRWWKRRMEARRENRHRKVGGLYLLQHNTVCYRQQHTKVQHPRMKALQCAAQDV